MKRATAPFFTKNSASETPNIEANNGAIVIIESCRAFTRLSLLFFRFPGACGPGFMLTPAPAGSRNLY